jgi:hypothetical protein
MKATEMKNLLAVSNLESLTNRLTGVANFCPSHRENMPSFRLTELAVYRVREGATRVQDSGDETFIEIWKYHFGKKISGKQGLLRDASLSYHLGFGACDNAARGYIVNR